MRFSIPTLVFAFVTFAPFVSATPPGKTGPKSCKKDEFWWPDKECCLPVGGPPVKPQPPKGIECPPTGYYWGDKQKCCVPKHNPPPKPPKPDCPKNWEWNPGTHQCSPIPPPKPPQPPKPTQPPKPPQPPKPTQPPKPPQPPKPTQPPKPPQPPKPTQPPKPPQPPKPTQPPQPPKPDCPKGWEWNPIFHKCLPIPHPPQPPKPTQPPKPDCPKGWEWNPILHKCLPIPHPPQPPKPQPSKSWQHPHGGKKRSVEVLPCPSGLTACSISGLTFEDYECLDISAELESCGGCTSEGTGQDCTAIRGAWNVGCERGACKVYSCAAGFAIDADGTSCRSLQ